MHALTVVNTYLRLGLLNVMQYRADFFMQLVSIVVSLGTALLTIGVVFGQTDDIGGWTEPDLIALIGVQMLVRASLASSCGPSMERLMENIRMGTLDFMLTKPADSQLLASVAQVNVAASADVVGGAIVLALALGRLGSAVGLLESGLFVIMLLCGVVMVYAFLLATSTLAFWFVRPGQPLVIF
jgi:ABC-2 type transport system permease protein